MTPASYWGFLGEEKEVCFTVPREGAYNFFYKPSDKHEFENEEWYDEDDTIEIMVGWGWTPCIPPEFMKGF